MRESHAQRGTITLPNVSQLSCGRTRIEIYPVSFQSSYFFLYYKKLPLSTFHISHFMLPCFVTCLYPCLLYCIIVFKNKTMLLIISPFPTAHWFLAVSCVCMLGSVRLFVALWTLTCQAHSLSIEIFQTKILGMGYYASSRDLPYPCLLSLLHWPGRFFFYQQHPWEAMSYIKLTSRDACCRERFVGSPL